MSKSNEALDAVKDERPFAGVHILATAMLCAAGASADELELARRLLVCDPKKDGPREAESVAGAFNRQMDAAIESCNDSAHNPTRAGRRALLARDLDRAGLVLIDRAELALLLDRGAPCRPRIVDAFYGIGDNVTPEHDGHDLAAELTDGSTIAIDAMPSSSGGVVGLEFQTGVTFLTHTPRLDVAATGSAFDVEQDPNLND